jgi:hypothetical protein
MDEFEQAVLCTVIAILIFAAFILVPLLKDHKDEK